MNLQPHKYATAYPEMPADELQALADDIKKRGQYQSILIYEGKILDGRHRYKACLMAGKVPRTIPYKGTDPLGLVESLNGHRRHVTASQRAIAKAMLSEWRGVGRQNNSAAAAELPGKTAAELAKEAHVSTRTIEHAKAVVANGSGKLKKAVVAGEISVEKAAESLKPKKRGQTKPPKADPRDARIAQLETKLEGVTENLPELSNLAASAKAFEDKQEFKDMVALRAELDATRRRRDELMNENAELKKTVAYWKRQAEKMKAAA